MLGGLSKAEIRPLVELNDKINSLTSLEREINSTRIVVVGDQSHGKSSLLEALSGIDLPRGEDIKTRVPLVMQLRNIAHGSPEHALISAPGIAPEKIELAAIATKVDEYTAKIAGASKAVHDVEIQLKVYRHDQDDLTLIDLPGITRVAQEGQGDGTAQAGQRLEKLIMDMCRRYAKPPESIILNVVSAMVDFSTSASLQLSRELDPSGQRTMLCVTKVDQHREIGLHKKLENATRGMQIRREHIFAVRNRTNEENQRKLSLTEARRLETQALSDNEELARGSQAAGYGLGVEMLSKKLVVRINQLADVHIPHDC